MLLGQADEVMAAGFGIRIHSVTGRRLRLRVGNAARSRNDIAGKRVAVWIRRQVSRVVENSENDGMSQKTAAPKKGTAVTDMYIPAPWSQARISVLLDRSGCESKFPVKDVLNDSRSHGKPPKIPFDSFSRRVEQAPDGLPIL